MKSIISLLFMLMTFSMDVFPQNETFYPERMVVQPCVGCQGRGSNTIFFVSGRPPLPSICSYCSGSGKAFSSYYYHNCGSALGQIARGTNAIRQRNYQEAYRLFSHVYNNLNVHNKGAEAAFWVGTCYELGIGVYPDKNKAYEFYEYSKNNHCNLAAFAIDRIRRDGFYEADETSRKNFIAQYDRYQYFQYVGNQMMNESNREIDRMINETNKEIREIRKNEKMGCIYCNGTGHYSNPNQKYFSEGYYTCANCGERQSYSRRHSCVCKKCRGKGEVNRW